MNFYFNYLDKDKIVRGFIEKYLIVKFVVLTNASNGNSMSEIKSMILNMATGIRLIINKIFLNPRRLFMVDGSGAFLTAMLLGLILIRFENSFGMPGTILYFLSSIACIYALYSFCCFFFISNNWKPYLKIITIANWIYCCLTIGLIVYFYQRLTILGLIYFTLEILVIIGLIFIELMVLSSRVDRRY